MTISSASAANAGTYSVIVSNDIDYAVSDGAGLTVLPVSQPGATFYSLRSFSGNLGLNPFAGLTWGKDNYLYGTTLNGGSAGYGTAFRITTSGFFGSLHSFTNGLDGGSPYAGLVRGTDGNFYGATFQGGADLSGVLFKMTSSGGITPLYAFSGGDDGAGPAASLVQGVDGKLYGTAYQGGTNDLGSVFSLTTNGVFAPQVSFDGDNGAYPEAPLIQATNGLFYGCAYTGGSNGMGTVFSLTTNGVLTTLVSFNYTNGAEPAGALMQANDGFLYGTTVSGGTNGGWGTVFRLGTDGTLTTLYSFGYNDGAAPAAALIQATDGNFYGTTSDGGWGGQGTVFRLTPNGVLTTVVWFNGSNGANPQAPITQTPDGSFCGTAAYGGVNYNGVASTGDGLIFRLELPMFLSNPFTQAVAAADSPYSASLTTNALRPPADSVLFSKLSGPAWLAVGADGTLSGTPAVSDIGANTFGVSLFDTNGWSCTATMFITVTPSPYIKAAIVRTAGTVWLTWSGRTAPYQVQTATNLQSPVWVNLGGPVNTNFLLLTPTSPAYYRVESQ